MFNTRILIYPCHNNEIYVGEYGMLVCIRITYTESSSRRLFYQQKYYYEFFFTPLYTYYSQSTSENIVNLAHSSQSIHTPYTNT